MHSDSEESPSWLARYWWIVAVIVLLLLGFFPAFAPRYAKPAEPETVAADSVLTDCGTVTRDDTGFRDTTFIWYEYENGIRADRTLRVLKETTVKIGTKYKFVFTPRNLVLSADSTAKCPKNASTSSAGISFFSEYT